MKRNFFRILTAAVLCCAMLAGLCLTASAEPVKLVVATWDGGNNDQMQRTLADAFTEKTGIEVEYLSLSSDTSEYKDKLAMMLNAQTYLDCAFMMDGAQMPPLMERGQIEPITDLVARDIDKELYSGKFDVFTKNGEIYGFPFRGDYYVMYYNKDLFDAAGVAYPTDDMTWDEFEELAAKLTSGEGMDKVYGASIYTAWPGMICNFAWATGRYTVVDGNYDCLKPYYERMLRMQDAGTLKDYSILSTSGEGTSDSFVNGKAAMYVMGTWDVSTMIQLQKEGTLPFQWDVTRAPHTDKDDVGYMVGSVTPVAIIPTTQHKEEAWEFIKFICGEEGAKIITSYGYLPAINTKEVLDAYAQADGMPEHIQDALNCVHFSMDKPPMADKITECYNVIKEEHSLMMLKEETIDEGIANINQRVSEIQ